jgi:hypothetical protein
MKNQRVRCYGTGGTSKSVAPHDRKDAAKSQRHMAKVEIVINTAG